MRQRVLAARGVLHLGNAVLLALIAAVAFPFPQAEATDHECQIFGLVYDDSGAYSELFERVCGDLWASTLPESSGRVSPSRDGWGFGYFLSPPDPRISRPILLKAGPPACEDSLRWAAALTEIEQFGLGSSSVVLGHVRKSSYGPDNGALPDPHPFSDSLWGRWWLFSHNGHTVPDTLLQWIPAEFLERHPLDYSPIYVDSEVLFRYLLFEIESRGNVKDALLFAFNRIKNYDDFVFNICLTDGDTLWAAHTLSYTPFYFGSTADSLAWWVTTVKGTWEDPEQMQMHHLYWFAPGGMGSASYE